MMGPIFVLTLRALGRGRRLLVVAVLLVVPAALAAVYRASAPYAHTATATSHPGHDVAQRFVLPFVVGVFDVLVMPILLPLTALIFATSALGGEVEDRTLLYLTLRPVSRLSIVVAKALAAALITVVLVEVSVVALYFVGMQGLAGLGDGFGAILLAGLAGCPAYCSLFLLVGLLTSRALLLGFLYVLVWEGIAAGLSTALATLSVRRYVQGILHAGLGNLSAASVAPSTLSGGASVVALAAVVVMGVAGSTWLLRRIGLP